MNERHPRLNEGSHRRGVLREGERVQLIDQRGRRHTVTLTPMGVLHTHRGFLRHEHILGLHEGSVVTNSGGVRYAVLRPLLQDYVLSMPRAATVVYPKDAAQIVTMGDIFPGARVLEAGVGSGALTISLLRAVGVHGHVHSFEVRSEFADIARGNIATYFGASPQNWELSLGAFQEQAVQRLPGASVDRVVLDMLRPWECLEAVASLLVPGGVWVNYVASVPQLSRVVEAIRADGRFTEPHSWETLTRGWHVDSLAIRPDHRMVAHTGFLVMTRRLADEATAIEPYRRGRSSAPRDEDLDAWSVQTMAAFDDEPGISSRKLRKVARRAQPYCPDPQQ